jgi:hypothetical protein
MEIQAKHGVEESLRLQQKAFGSMQCSSRISCHQRHRFSFKLKANPTRAMTSTSHFLQADVRKLSRAWTREEKYLPLLLHSAHCHPITRHDAAYSLCFGAYAASHLDKASSVSEEL